MKANMTFKELEEFVNRGVNLKDWRKGVVESTSVSSMVECVRNKILKILRGNGLDKCQLFSYRGSLYLNTEYNQTYGCEPEGVKISIKKEKDKENSTYFETRYKFKNIEIEVQDKYYVYNKDNRTEFEVKTIQDYIDYKNECKRAKEEYKNNKKEDFKSMLRNKGLDLKDFIKLAQSYKALDYDTKRELAREIDNENAYKYIV